MIATRNIARPMLVFHRSAISLGQVWDRHAKAGTAAVRIGHAAGSPRVDSDQEPVTRRSGVTLPRPSFAAELQYAAQAAISLRRFSSASLRR